MILKDDTITIQDMAAIVNVSEITIKRDLALLQKKGILTHEGGRKEGRWVIKQAAD
jgi:DeoR/GlpR family transcriptional regulator of sugar metabolism